MARLVIKIVPVHADDTPCEHKVKPSGNPKEPGCTGRDAYRVTCSGCPDLDSKHALRVLAEPARDEHRASHLAAPAPTAPVAAGAH